MTADHEKPQEKKTIELSYGLFEPGERVRFRVTPLNAYGCGGAPLLHEYVVPLPKKVPEVVFDRDWTEREFPLLRNGRPMSLVLPKGAFAGPEKSRFRLSCDIRTEQANEGSTFDMRLVRHAHAPPC